MHNKRTIGDINAHCSLSDRMQRIEYLVHLLIEWQLVQPIRSFKTITSFADIRYLLSGLRFLSYRLDLARGFDGLSYCLCGLFYGRSRRSSC